MLAISHMTPNNLAKFEDFQVLQVVEKLRRLLVPCFSSMPQVNLNGGGGAGRDEKSVPEEKT